jgi:hypothetical protein
MLVVRRQLSSAGHLISAEIRRRSIVESFLCFCGSFLQLRRQSPFRFSVASLKTAFFF